MTRSGLMLASALLAACSSGSDEADEAGGSGTVVAPWTDYCTATFTQDTPISDPFGDPMFTARTGEAYLLSSLGTGRADFVFLTNAGPDTFDIEQSTGDFPFMSNCAVGATASYTAVF